MNLHLPVAALAVAAVAGTARAQEPEVRVLEVEPQVTIEEMVVDGDGDGQTLFLAGPDGRLRVMRGDGEGKGKGKAKGRKGGGEGDLKADILREVDRRIERHLDALRAEIRDMLGERGERRSMARKAAAPHVLELEQHGMPGRRIQVRPGQGERHAYRIETHGEARDGHGKARIRIEHDGKVIEKELPFDPHHGGPQSFDLPGGGKMQFHFEGGPHVREFRFEGPEGGPGPGHFRNFARSFRMGPHGRMHPEGEGEGEGEGEEWEDEGEGHEDGPRAQRRAHFQVNPHDFGPHVRAYAQRALERLGKHGDVEVEVLGDKVRELGPEIRKALGKLHEHLGEGDFRDIEKSIRDALRGLEGGEGERQRLFRAHARPGRGPHGEGHEDGEEEEERHERRPERPRREHDF